MSAAHSRRQTAAEFRRLIDTARRLRGPGGCRWDRAQTVSSLLPYLVEETWELFASIRRRHRAEAVREELGDVLYTALTMALMCEERGWWTLDDMLCDTRRKMIRRHPHVFGNAAAATASAAHAHWQAIKQRERPGPSISKRVRPLLVALWEAIADAAYGDARALTRSRQASGKTVRSRGR